MKKELFFEELAESLEIEESVNEQTVIELDSLSILVLIVFLDENFDIQVKADDLQTINTVSDLMKLIGNKII